MKKLLITQALLALSVSALTAELAGNAYSVEALDEALAAEAAGDNRKTAIEALTEARELAASEPEQEPELAASEPEQEPELAASEPVKVVEGKSITSKRGVLVAGEVVTADDFAGGAETIAQLIERGCVK